MQAPRARFDRTATSPGSQPPCRHCSVPETHGSADGIGHLGSTSIARGTLQRRALLERVCHSQPDIAVISAPAGYGKSTFVTQWIAHDSRPSRRLLLTRSDDDADRLSQRLTDELTMLRDPGSGADDVSRAVLLVLEDAHLVTSPDALGVLAATAAGLPEGSTLALTGRSVPDLVLGLTRARRRVLEIGQIDLAFDVDDVATLWTSMGLDASLAELEGLVERTEGWPAAIRLAADGSLAADDPHGFLCDFAGDDTHFAELIHTEFLRSLAADDYDFLLAVAPIDQLSGRLCDHVLGRTGSAMLLERLSRQTLFVVPLDRRRTWYRLHRMVLELLRAEADRRAHSDTGDVLLRASTWHEQRGELDAAITYAARAHDAERATAIVLDHFSDHASRGKPQFVESWLDLLHEAQLAANPSLQSVGALVRMGLGDPAGALRLLRRAEFGVVDRHPDGGPHAQSAACVAALRAVIGTQSASEMRADAQYAAHHTTSPVWCAIAWMADGAASFMLGDLDLAADALSVGAAHAETCSFTTFALCYAHLALIADHRSQHDDALRHIRHAKQVVAAYSLESAPQIYLVQLTSAWMELRAGHESIAFSDRIAGRESLARGIDLAPWAMAQGCLALARFDRLRGDTIGKLRWIDAAEAAIRKVPDASLVIGQIAEMRQHASPIHTRGTGVLSSLTSSELRVLHYLPTHLTLAEIADQLYLSRHTVKSHVMSMYRKLGTSSRNETVELVRHTGLLSDPPASIAPRHMSSERPHDREGVAKRG